MKNNFIHINGEMFDLNKIEDQLNLTLPAWKLSGFIFVQKLLDPGIKSISFNTSGTTGQPKEVSYSKEQILQSANNTCRYFGINGSSKLLLCLPTQFVAGRLMMARAFVSGASLIWEEPSLNPIEYAEEVDLAAFTPAQVLTIISNPKGRQKLEAIPQVIIGGGEISFTLEKELTPFKNNIFATYGMTETLTHVAVRKIGQPIYHSVYDDLLFSVNKDNCLVINLPCINTEAIITKDVVELINEKSFIWKGRLDHVINTGGVKVNSEDIEQRIIKAGILSESQFYISAQKDEIFGEVPVIVLLRGDSYANMATLLSQVNSKLNKYELVKHVIILDKFEFTPTGKLKRQKF
jgi:o-succinylbenzoate---CoA ligase